MAKQTTGKPERIYSESLNNGPTSPKKTGLGAVTEKVTGELVPELGDINWEEIIEKIKSIGNWPFFQIKTGIPKIFRNKLEWKEIPMEYRQKIVDEIGKAGGCSFVIFHPGYFEETTIYNCVCDALKKGERLNDYCFNYMVSNWKSLDYLKLWELILKFDPNIDSKWNIKDAIMKYLYNMWDWMCHKWIFREWVRNNELAQNYEYKTIPNKILESNWFFLLPDLLEDQSLWWMGEPTDEFYWLLADKLIENYENLDGQDKRKLKEYLLNKTPYVFLEKVEKLPEKLLIDEKILKMLGEWSSIDVEVFDKYANRLIDAWDWHIIFNKSKYFQWKIDYLDKIKKIIECDTKQKWHNIENVFRRIYWLYWTCRIKKEQLGELAKICIDAWLDIKKYPITFWKTLYEMDPKNIELLLNTFNSYTKFWDGYMVTTIKDNRTVYWFVKDGEVIFDGCDLYNFHKSYEEYEKNKRA